MNQIEAVIFDISGTVIDYGSRAPAAAFVELFTRNRVPLTEAEARKPMGLPKRDHIRALLGAHATDTQVDGLFQQLTPILLEIIGRHADLIPGVLEVTHELRRRGIRFANTTGFDSNMIAGLIPTVEQNGYKPDLWMTPDTIAAPGRPAPWMAFHIAREFNIYPMSKFVKVGDTLADIEEAHSAGMWAVAVVRHGNEVGLSREAIEALPYDDWKRMNEAARARLATRNPHYIIDSTAGLLVVIDQINARLARGEKP